MRGAQLLLVVVKKKKVRVNYNYGELERAALSTFDVLGTIQKITVPYVGFRMASLHPDDYQDISEFTNRSGDVNFCNISSSVIGVLEWTRSDANSEDGLHGRDDYFLRIITIISGAEQIRNSRDLGSCTTKRHDSCLLLSGVPVVRVEEKSAGSDLSIARNELRGKMRAWLSHYGNIPYIIGVAIAGDSLNIYSIDREMRDRELCALNMKELDDRIQAVRAAVQLGRLLRLFKSMIHPSSQQFYRKIFRDRCKLYLTNEHVKKWYKDARVRDKVVLVLKLIAEQNILNTIRLLENLSDGGALKLGPVGIGIDRAPLGKRNEIHTTQCSCI